MNGWEICLWAIFEINQFKAGSIMHNLGIFFFLGWCHLNHHYCKKNKKTNNKYIQYSEKQNWNVTLKWEDGEENNMITLKKIFSILLNINR